jgi:hypothetical protein
LSFRQAGSLHQMCLLGNLIIRRAIHDLVECSSTSCTTPEASVYTPTRHGAQSPR